MKRLFIAVFAITVFLGFLAIASADDERKTEAGGPAVTLKKEWPKVAPGKPGTMPIKPNFSMVFGSIANIDNRDPAKTVIEVKSEMDNKVHSIEIAPGTSITKVTDSSELKTGDTVRVMTRTVNEKEVAMGLMFGNIRAMPRPTPPAVTPPAKQERPKK